MFPIAACRPKGMVGGGAFTPASLSPALWLEADDLSTLYKSVDSTTTPVTANNDPVATWTDKSGNGFNLRAQDGTLAPAGNAAQYKTSGDLHWVETVATNSNGLYRLAALGLYAAAGCSIFVAADVDGSVVGRYLIAEGDAASTSSTYGAILSGPSANSQSTFIRNSASATLVTQASTENASAFAIGTPKVYGFTDDGATIRSYINGVAGATTGYTRSGSLTQNTFGLGCAHRSGNVGSLLVQAKIYAVVIVKRVLTDTERANLTTYLGTKAGLSV